ncbi:MAG: Asp-tRNA(Asn)/Glu-tRNA(Gln) amidotransferase subunit GatC [Sphingobacteriales bacterium]|nr:Asp-tRNA(Asn)/Glu-tRNA(Gln) amidotransferase subunit GatC [Sphingobacteriales bacterium]
MEVTDQLVENLARLARLEFNDADKAEIKNDLQKMIAFVDKLNELDTRNVEPLLHMSDNVNMLRKDEVKGSVSREEALSNAPEKTEKYFKVPKVINNPLSSNQ